MDAVPSVPSYKIDPELKRLWVARLRSDDVVQIKGFLRNAANGRCCLGVACDVVMEQRQVGAWDHESWTIPGHPHPPFISYCLPTLVAEALGFPVEDEANSNYYEPPLPFTWSQLYARFPNFYTANGQRPQDPAPVALSLLNDGGLTFDEIADLIEELL